MLVPDQQSAELTEPGIGSLHDPTSLIAAQFAPVLVSPMLVVLAVRRDQFDATFLQPLPQRVGVVAAVGDHAFGLLPRASLRARDTDFGERGFRKRNFCRRGTFQPNSQRKTLTVDQYHPLRALAPLGFADGKAGPFFLRGRSCRPRRSRPTAADLPHPVPLAGRARRPARPLRLPIALAVASRSREKEIRPAENAMPHRFAESTECLRNRPGSTPTVVRGCLCLAWAQATRAQLTPIARPLTASAASS